MDSAKTARKGRACLGLRSDCWLRGARDRNSAIVKTINDITAAGGPKRVALTCLRRPARERGSGRCFEMQNNTNTNQI